MQTLFKPSSPLCRHGMRNDCPVEQCHFQNTEPTLLYSTALKGPAPAALTQDRLTATNDSFAQSHQFGTHDKFPGETYRFQHAKATPLYPAVNDSAAPLLSRTSGTGTTVGTGPVDPIDGRGLAQAADHLAFYRVWLQSQMDAQMARVQKMSEQFSIPIPNLDLKPFEFPLLSLMPSPVGNEVTTKTMTQQETHGRSVLDGRKPQDSPPTARTIASGPFSARAPMAPRPSPLDQELKPVAPAGVIAKHPQATSIAPKKEDLAYKTTPCRHFTLNQGWCPWGDACGFIHDPELEWVPASERTSGRSTPSSLTLAGNKSVLYDKTTVEPEVDLRRSVSSKSAHCWGYIQGVCPHSETCKYLHPADIVPYIKYTPCLTWPRCGYPALACPLKHPQVDKLTPPSRSQPPSTPNTTTIVPQARSGIAPRAEKYSDTLPPPQRQSQQPSTTAPLTPAGGLVIPHDEAYASARLHHRPTIPSAEMFTPAPARPVVRLRRPSEDLPRDQAVEMQCGLGVGSYQGRARSVSIAVQRLNGEFSGPVLQAPAKAFARGHGRGKSLNL
ncbi:hypothetical protein BJV77DRAFT_723618 [Russula vinacea]|nr:hypothetical protein BJV77DRAFT_723618 [Russula vinacea]